jgi:phage I-like protein
MATKKSKTDTQDSTRAGSKKKGKSARSTASEATEKTREEASRLSDQAKEQFAGQAERQKAQASDQLDDIGEALRKTSDTLHEEDKDSVANLTEGAAQQIERLSGYLRDRSVNEMLSEAKRFARRKPGMFLGGAAVLGFFGSRFFRSSDPDDHHHRHVRHVRHS